MSTSLVKGQRSHSVELSPGGRGSFERLPTSGSTVNRCWNIVTLSLSVGSVRFRDWVSVVLSVVY